MGRAGRPDTGGPGRADSRALGPDGEGGGRTLLELARSTEAQGTDAKAEALLELIYKLQQEENDPELKVLVFTEFVPTQTMLADFLEGRGFTVATLNGSMDLDARTRAQQAFSRDVRRSCLDRCRRRGP
jgi:SNF2 family DNA or RNA helicase